MFPFTSVCLSSSALPVIALLKFDMDHSLQLVVLFLGLLLNTDVSLQKPSDVSSTSKPSNVSATPVSTHHPAAQSPRTSPEVITSPPLREVVLVTVAWEKNNPCEGPVHLTLPRGRKEPKRRICFESPYKEHFEGLCPQTNCGGFKKWEASESGSFQYVDDHGTVTVRENCTALVIQCTGVTKTRKSKPSEGASVQEQQTYQVPSHIGLIKAPNVFNYHNESSFLLPFIFLPLMQQATVGSWLHIRPSQVCFLYWCWLFSSSATGDLHTPPSAKDCHRKGSRDGLALRRVKVFTIIENNRPDFIPTTTRPRDTPIQQPWKSSQCHQAESLRLTGIATIHTIKLKPFCLLSSSPPNCYSSAPHIALLSHFYCAFFVLLFDNDCHVHKSIFL